MVKISLLTFTHKTMKEDQFHFVKFILTNYSTAENYSKRKENI